MFPGAEERTGQLPPSGAKLPEFSSEKVPVSQRHTSSQVMEQLVSEQSSAAKKLEVELNFAMSCEIPEKSSRLYDIRDQPLPAKLHNAGNGGSQVMRKPPVVTSNSLITFVWARATSNPRIATATNRIILSLKLCETNSKGRISNDGTFTGCNTLYAPLAIISSEQPRSARKRKIHRQDLPSGRDQKIVSPPARQPFESGPIIPITKAVTDPKSEMGNSQSNEMFVL